MTPCEDSEASVDAGRWTRRATHAEGRVALRYEASLLHMLRHPGVTELIRITDGDDATELTTRSGSDRTLADWDGTQGESVDTAVIVGVLASLATTCADLHDLGVVHGRIEPQRVAIPPSGQPVLTGFQAAGPIGARRPEAERPLPPFCDPAAAPAQPLDPASDVFGLGALLEHLLERHPPSPADPARSTRRRLRRLARSATSEHPDRRPDAASFAAALLDAAPAAHLPGDQPPHPPPEATQRAASLHRPSATPEPSSSRRRIRPLVVGVAAALVGVVALLTVDRSRPPATSKTATVAPAGSVAPTIASVVGDGPTDEVDESPAAAVASTAPTTTAPPTTSAPPPAPTSGSPAARSSADTIVVVFDGVRYRIGGGPRRWAIGDWDCDGGATLATLDPASGALTFFEAWPRSGTTRAVATDRVPGAVDLRAQSSGDCHELVVVHGDRIDTYESTGGTP